MISSKEWHSVLDKFSVIQKRLAPLDRANKEEVEENLAFYRVASRIQTLRNKAYKREMRKPTSRKKHSN